MSTDHITTRPAVFSWLGFLAAVGLLTYYVGLRGQYFGDDYKFFLAPLSSNLFHFFIHKNPYNEIAYRPLEAVVLMLIQDSFATDTLLIHALALLIHVLLCWLVFRAALDLGFSALQAKVASVFMMLAQVNAMAVLSNDTLSQLLGTLFGCLSVWLLFRAYGGQARETANSASTWKYLTGSVTAFLAALFSKETSASFVMILACTGLLVGGKQSLASVSIKRRLTNILFYLLPVLIYFAARVHAGVAGPRLGPGPYGFHIGGNILHNAFLFSAASIVPVSTVEVYQAVISRNITVLSAAAGGALLFTALLSCGVWLAGRAFLVATLTGYSILSLFPAVIMNHVSELYAYNAMPFFSLIVGLALGRLFEVSRSTRPLAAVVASLIAMLAAAHWIGVRGKALLMLDNGYRSTQLIDEIVSLVPDVPPGGEILLINPPEIGSRYSVFLLPGFTVLDLGLHRISQLSGRDDYSLKIVDSHDSEVVDKEEALLLTVEGNRVVKYRRRTLNPPILENRNHPHPAPPETHRPP
jgi:hypothetical protein